MVDVQVTCLMFGCIGCGWLVAFLCFIICYLFYGVVYLIGCLLLIVGCLRCYVGVGWFCFDGLLVRGSWFNSVVYVL